MELENYFRVVKFIHVLGLQTLLHNFQIISEGIFSIAGTLECKYLEPESWKIDLDLLELVSDDAISEHKDTLEDQSLGIHNYCYKVYINSAPKKVFNEYSHCI